MKSNDLEAVSKSVASMIEEWVDGGLKMGTDWRPGLASVIELRLARFADKPAITTVDLANADADGYRNGRESVVVELPELRGDSDADDIAGVGLVIPMFDRGYDEAIEECRAAIIAAGGSVKECPNG